MIVILVGLAYYAVESKNLTTETGSTPERGTALLIQTQNEMERALEEKPYTATNVSTYNTAFQNKSERAGFDLTINCNETQTTTGTHNYPKYELDCFLLLKWENANLSSAFDHDYTVPFEIKTFSDANHTQETNFFNINDTVYYKITGRNNDVINLSVTYKRNQEYTQNHTLSNHYDTGSFVADNGGPWFLDLTNYNTSETYRHIIHVQSMRIEIEPEGRGSEWQPRKEFIRGEPMRVKVTTRDLRGELVSVPVMITIRKENDSPPIGNYDTEGTTDQETGTFTTPELIINENEEPGTLYVTVTEGQYKSTNTTTIEILANAYGTFVEVDPPDMTYNKPAQQAFGDSCGYGEWFESNQQTYDNGTHEIPFYLENQTGNQVISANNQDWEINTPQIHAQRIHIIGSKHNPEQ